MSPHERGDGEPHQYHDIDKRSERPPPTRNPKQDANDGEYPGEASRHDNRCPSVAILEKAQSDSSRHSNLDTIWLIGTPGTNGSSFQSVHRQTTQTTTFAGPSFDVTLHLLGAKQPPDSRLRCPDSSLFNPD
jgi:hypothetical protein